MQFKRRRSQKTDYDQRLALLKSGKLRIVVRRSNSQYRLQIVSFQPTGDRTLLEVTSAHLRAFGWKGSTSNMAAAYLTGLLLGTRAKAKNIDSAIPDLGLNLSIHASSLYACLMGAKDGGLSIPIGKEALPKRERIEGKHVAEYAKLAKTADVRGYQRQFGAYLKQGLEPEKLPEHVAQVKQAIMAQGATPLPKAKHTPEAR